MNIYWLIITQINKTIDKINLYHGGLKILEIKKIPDNLVHNDKEFKNTYKTFTKYVEQFHKDCIQRLEYITLKMYIMIFESPQGKYSIGQEVFHNNKQCIVVDYLHQLDVYEIKYHDHSVFNETHGWFHDTDLHSTSA